MPEPTLRLSVTARSLPSISSSTSFPDLNIAVAPALEDKPMTAP
jgi:hypothetical protein